MLWVEKSIPSALRLMRKTAISFITFAVIISYFTFVCDSFVGLSVRENNFAVNTNIHANSKGIISNTFTFDFVSFHRRRLSSMHSPISKSSHCEAVKVIHSTLCLHPGETWSRIWSKAFISAQLASSLFLFPWIQRTTDLFGGLPFNLARFWRAFGLFAFFTAPQEGKIDIEIHF